MPSTETESDMAINKVFIAGNLTRDAELRATSNTHTPVLSFTVAVNERRRNQQNGEWEDYPNFIACVLYGRRCALPPPDQGTQGLRRGASALPHLSQG